MSKGGEARNHHWVPQCYLKGFAKSRSKNAKLFVIDAVGRKSFETIPRNVASARDFNRIEVEGIAPNHVESALGRFEGEVDKAIERMCEARGFSSAEDFNLILNLIALLSIRNPRMRENYRDFRERAAKTMMQVTLANEECFRMTMTQAAAAGAVESADAISYDEMREFVQRGEYRVEVPTTHHVEQELNLVDTILPLLGKRRWKLLRAQGDSGGFITSDHPVILRWTEQRDRAPFYSPGFGLRNTEVIFTLSSELALVGVFNEDGGAVDVPAQIVATINGLVIAYAERQVYARHDRFRYLSVAGEVRRGTDALRDLPDSRSKVIKN